MDIASFLSYVTSLVEQWSFPHAHPPGPLPPGFLPGVSSSDRLCLPIFMEHLLCARAMEPEREQSQWKSVSSRNVSSRQGDRINEISKLRCRHWWALAGREDGSVCMQVGLRGLYVSCTAGGGQKFSSRRARPDEAASCRHRVAAEPRETAHPPPAPHPSASLDKWQADPERRPGCLRVRVSVVFHGPGVTWTYSFLDCQEAGRWPWMPGPGVLW